MPEYKEFLSIDEIAKDYAIRRHRAVNHYYDSTHEYSFHLEMTINVAKRFIHLIPELDRKEVLGGCWVHDVIEDTRESFNNVKKETNKTIAEYAFACTNEKGKTRKERANKKYYDGIKCYKHASFIKLCDRIANVQFSKSISSSMFEMYKKEFEDFYTNLYDGRWEEMWDYLKELFEL